MMTKSLIDLDDEALAEAATLLDTETEVATVNVALREVIRRREVQRFLRHAAAEGYDDGLDEAVSASAWR